MAQTLKANYSAITGLNAGDLLTNANGKRKLTIIESTRNRARNRSGYTVEITETMGGDTFTYRHFLTWGEIETRFPIKLENNRYSITIENLTEDEFAEVKALLARREMKIAKVA